MKCSKCGAENEAGSKFCESCGEKLEAPKKTTSSKSSSAKAVCPSCGKENKKTAKFCEECGTSLAPKKPEKVKCPQCGKEYKAGTKFCSDCGSTLAAEAAPAAAAAPAPAQDAGAQDGGAQAAQQPDVGEESIHNEITFITSFLTFYLKGSIKLEQNFMKFAIPNTILAFIPLGKQTRSIPVNHIANVDTNFRMEFKRFFGGLVLTIAGFACVAFAPPLLVLGLLGIMVILNSFFTDVQIHDTSGGEIFCPFIIFQKSKAELAAEQIRRIISNRLDDTNTRIHTENQTNVLVNALNQNNQQ